MPLLLLGDKEDADAEMQSDGQKSVEILVTPPINYDKSLPKTRFSNVVQHSDLLKEFQCCLLIFEVVFVYGQIL